MASNCGPAPQPKPWEHSAGSSTPVPFKPPSTGSTSEIVQASGNTKAAGEIAPANTAAAPSVANVPRPLPPRPWQQGYGGFGSNMYNPYGGFGNSLARGWYGGMYSGYNSGNYGVGLYNKGYMSPYNGYGVGSVGPYGNGNQDPKDPFGGAPASPPGLWMSMLRMMHGVVMVFGRMAMLVDQNTQALHIFMTALLELFNHSGMLYSEIAMFVFNLLGLRRLLRRKKVAEAQGAATVSKIVDKSWDSVWASDIKN